MIQQIARHLAQQLGQRPPRLALAGSHHPSGDLVRGAERHVPVAHERIRQLRQRRPSFCSARLETLGVEFGARDSGRCELTARVAS